MARLFFFIFIIQPCFLQARLTIVFDIDETLCFRVSDQAIIESISRRYPQMKIITDLKSAPTHTYFLIPHFDLLIRFLLEKDFEIHFFSAAGHSRNQELIDRMMIMSFGTDKYADLQKQGQFFVFSKVNMHPRFLNVVDVEIDKLNWYVKYGKKLQYAVPSLDFLDMPKLTKSLRQLFPEKDINDVILVDDRIENATSYYFEQVPNPFLKEGVASEIQTNIVHDKTELPLLTAGSCKNLLDLLNLGLPNQQALLVLNSSFYFCGVISHCLNLLKTNRYKNLREVLAIALNIDENDHEFSNLLSPDNHELNPNLSFFLELGLRKFKAFMPDIAMGSLKPRVVKIEYYNDDDDGDDFVDISQE